MPEKIPYGKAATKLFCKVVDIFNNGSNWGQNARIEGEFTIWKLKIDRIQNVQINEEAMCRALQSSSNQCPANDPVKNCIEEASKRAGEARSSEDNRHNSAMRSLIDPAGMQIFGEMAGEVCSVL